MRIFFYSVCKHLIGFRNLSGLSIINNSKPQVAFTITNPQSKHCGFFYSVCKHLTGFENLSGVS
ncbi:hypothetical protein FLJC2902T_19110 [Flavobacterium limnosediminis JC2902]|uniref:Uncharacterized protein n=1 Tax=Flavobacterium limnosediminis JC2902 TaxID=1341181 RepID=V6SPA4_9FLAO|nr:hypothetical protein FLJC2902T_19110 [Flavobacterium limnosediminis JC2902]